MRILPSCRPLMNKMILQSPPGAGDNFDFTNAPAAITTSPGSGCALQPSKSLLVPGPSLGPCDPADTPGWRPTFLSGTKSFLVSRVRARRLAPKPPGSLPEPRPPPCAPGTLQGAALLPPSLSLSIRCTQVCDASRYLAIPPRPPGPRPPERSARISKVGDTSQAGDPWGAAEGLLQIC